MAADDPCRVVDQKDAESLLGPAKSMAVGSMGCSYSNRDKGVRMTITAMDMGASAKQIWEGMKKKSQSAGWLAGDESGIGTVAYAELIKRSKESSAGRAAFIVVKGGNVIQIVVTDSAEKDDIAGKKEMLDKLRPVAKRIVDKF
jgi:hypothetical protein